MAVVRCFSLPFEDKSLSFPRGAIKISESSQKISDFFQKFSEIFPKNSETFLKLSEFFRTTLRLVEEIAYFINVKLYGLPCLFPWKSLTLPYLLRKT